MIGTLPELPNSRTFSTPGGRDGWWGKGRSRVWIDGCAERSGFRVGRFLGVMRIVRVRPRRDNWWDRSRIGSMWPCAGYGKMRMWADWVKIGMAMVFF
ncbi:hypothetical protein Vadar_001705 [Vaccinium darrowii]|uniref:Uncharacterized protein n=1 Tax=Vaccinium darrowii TaxID=229202 RepID=A0ACB7WXA1_9ERIC|nr:hypothetical protein Vadar_001705 [Vaccinium darrowii]